jgi:hypothetical protein
MSDTVDRARRLLESRLNEIEDEASGLREAIANLGGTARRPGSPKRGAAEGRKVTGKAKRRAPRGQRQKEVLTAARKQPGSTAAEIGRSVGISTNQAYALCKRMLKAGELKKKGKGYITAKA